MTQATSLESKTPLQKFYAGQNILITGGTGFLGKILIEKLLRSCPDLMSIYIIIRPKKGCDANQRLDSLLNGSAFDKIRKENPDYLSKIKALEGDCTLSGLGLSEEDRDHIIENVSIVFNVAATIKFNEKLYDAVAINVNGPREMINLCHRIKNLKSFVHVSTAFSNCTQKEIDERYYTPPMTGDSITKLVQIVEDKKLNSITETLLEDFPNTYTFTKCIAEHVVRELAHDLPTGIFRPAIVISSYHEPFPGWIDNYFGPTGVLAGGGSGILRVILVDVNCTTELVPVDLTVNALIATAWDVANNKKENKDPLIYNYTANWNKPFTWKKYIDLAVQYGYEMPIANSIWCYCLFTTKNIYLFHLLTTLLHIIPAILVDTIFFLMGKETRLMKGYTKVHNLLEAVTFFTNNSWKFNNLNIRVLWDKLSVEDQETFNFSMNDFDWNDYMHNCVHGMRTFIFKETEDSIPLAKKRMRRFYIMHNIIKYVIIGLLLWLLYSIISMVMTISTNISCATIGDSINIR